MKESATEEKLTPVVLAKQLAALKQQLVSSHLEKLLGPDAAINLTDPDGALAKWVPYVVGKSLLMVVEGLSQVLTGLLREGWPSCSLMLTGR